MARAAAAVTILLASWGPVLPAGETPGLYLWKDRWGRTHLTEDPPAEGGSIQERITPAPDPPAPPRRPAAKAVKEDQNAYKRCRLADEARQFALSARQKANALQSRAQDARRGLEDLKERVGYDDERLDDFKHDIRRLEKKARWLEVLAGLALLQADGADLQSRLAQSIAGDRCL
jgi:hypothetical protein